MPRLFVAVVAALLALGCAREARPIESAHRAAYPPVQYGWPPPTVQSPLPPAPSPLLAGIGASAAPPPAANDRALGTTNGDTPPPAVTKISSSEIPGGDRCMLELLSAGVSFNALDEKRGIDTPVEVHGPIAGISYGSNMIMDCRFALALVKLAPVLRAAGVSAFRQAGAYSYRMSRVGRLSLHAYGLAIDVHQFVVNGKLLTVSTDFTRGVDWCAPSSPALNQLACRLKATGLFRELLTPDYNADHHDHFHLGIAPVEGMPQKPKPPPVKHPERPTPSVPTHDEVLPPDDEPTVEPEAKEPEKTASRPARTKRPERPRTPRAHHHHTAHAKRRFGG